jgi:hypothetical protein
MITLGEAFLERAEPPNRALEQTAGSHALAAAAHRRRYAATSGQ